MADIGSVLAKLFVRPVRALGRVGRGIGRGVNEIAYGLNYESRASDLRSEAALNRRAKEAEISRADRLLELQIEQEKREKTASEALVRSRNVEAAANEAILAGRRTAARRKYGDVSIGEEQTIDAETGEVKSVKPMALPEDESIARFEADLLEEDRELKREEKRALAEQRRQTAGYRSVRGQSGALETEFRLSQLWPSLVARNLANVPLIEARTEATGRPKPTTARLDRLMRARLVLAYKKGRAAFKKALDESGLGAQIIGNTFGDDSAIYKTTVELLSSSPAER